MEIFVVLMGLYKVTDVMPQLTGTVTLRTGTGVHAFLCWVYVLASRRFFALFRLSRVTVYWYTVDFRQMNYYENIINIISIDSIAVVQQ